jgi:hypothetical protein
MIYDFKLVTNTYHGLHNHTWKTKVTISECHFILCLSTASLLDKFLLIRVRFNANNNSQSKIKQDDRFYQSNNYIGDNLVLFDYIWWCNK